MKIRIFFICFIKTVQHVSINIIQIAKILAKPTYYTSCNVNKMKSCFVYLFDISYLFVLNSTFKLISPASVFLFSSI